jgi:hypothetical protein
MAHDAFISYSHQDKPVADAACTILESSGIRCWVAPRDVPAGSQWAESIVEAIDRCRVTILIFSSRANISNQIHREVEHAVRRGKPIFPLRIEDVTPIGSMDYFLGAVHWLDALTPPMPADRSCAYFLSSSHHLAPEFLRRDLCRERCVALNHSASQQQTCSRAAHCHGLPNRTGGRLAASCYKRASRPVAQY